MEEECSVVIKVQREAQSNNLSIGFQESYREKDMIYSSSSP